MQAERSDGGAKVFDPGEASTEAIELARGLGLSITAADILHRGGFRDDENARRFLEPRLAHLTPPDAMADRDVSAERIARAIRAGERICVFGDYDCDGITAAAITTGILRALGGQVVPLLATRQEGSYGLSRPALARVFETGATLLITCDCGSSDHERLATARERGIDALVIDHHLVPPEPLPALAFLNPHRPECAFPYKGLASCGLALSLGAAVRRALGASLDVRPWLDLVAIGTIADVAPLLSDNRVLVRAGLGVLSSGARPGLRAIAENAKLDLARGVSAEDVAFKIAPRLNATGRLASPDLSLELLLEQNPSQAVAIAATIVQISLQRRALQDAMIAEATAEIERAGYDKAPAIVLAREGWHPGIVGIVAGRIVAKYRRPTIVVGIEGITGRGSVRGPSGVRLHDALSKCREALVGFGGHQAAAGVEVRKDRVEALRDLWCAAFSDASVSEEHREENEARVRLDDRDDADVVLRDLERIEPCGEANPAPLLLMRDVPIASTRSVKGGHLQVDLKRRGQSMRGFAFEMGDQAESLMGRRVDIVGRLRRNTWRGVDSVEIKIERIGWT